MYDSMISSEHILYAMYCDTLKKRRLITFNGILNLSNREVSKRGFLPTMTGGILTNMPSNSITGNEVYTSNDLT